MGSDYGVVSVYVVGEIMPNRDNPEEAVALTADITSEADIAYFQAEASMSDKGSPQLSGSSTRLPPQAIKAMVAGGFDIGSLTGNVSMDWGYEAFLDTIELMRSNGIAIVGAGRDIAEARRPAILERKGQRIAFLGYSTICPPGYEAQDEKPGLNPMRATTFYQQWDWQPGTPPRIVTIPNPDDLANLVEDVRRAKQEADVVFLTIHWGVHYLPFVIAQYQPIVAHAAIDAGADAIIGSHPHVLKGVEIYRGRPIFYSICDWVVDDKEGGWLDRPGFKSRYMERVKIYKMLYEPEYSYRPYVIKDARKKILVKFFLRSGEIEQVRLLPAIENTLGQPEIVSPPDPRAQEVLDYLRLATSEAELNGRFEWAGNEIELALEGAS